MRLRIIFVLVGLLSPWVTFAGSCGCPVNWQTRSLLANNSDLEDTLYRYRATVSPERLPPSGPACFASDSFDNCKDYNLWEACMQGTSGANCGAVLGYERYYVGDVPDEYKNRSSQMNFTYYLVGKCSFYPDNNDCSGVKIDSTRTAAPLQFKPLVPLPGGTTFGPDEKGQAQTAVISADTIGSYIADLINFLILAVTVLAVIMIMASGLRWVFSGGSPEKITKAKEGIMNSFMGLAIGLGSWMILYIINPRLIELKLHPIEDVRQINLETDGVATGTDVPGQHCDDCQDIKSVDPSIQCKNNCQAAPAVVAALGDLKALTDSADGPCPYQWRVTEAWPAKYTEHKDPAHYNGHAVDVNFVPSLGNTYRALDPVLQEKVDKFDSCLHQAGFRVLNEYKDPSLKSTAVHFHLNR